MKLGQVLVVPSPEARVAPPPLLRGGRFLAPVCVDGARQIHEPLERDDAVALDKSLGVPDEPPLWLPV